MIEYTVRVYNNGAKCWYLDDKRHREDGPAIEYSNGDKGWYLNGKEYTEQEYRDKVSPTKELTVGQLEYILGYKIKVVK